MSTLKSNAVVLLLSRIPTFLTVKGEVLGKDGDLFGEAEAGVFEELSGNKHYDTLTFANEKVLVHEDYSKDFKKKFKAIVENAMPEGAVVFPEENFIITTAVGETSKDRKKYLSRLLEGSKGFEILDDAIFIKKWDEYYLAPVINVATLPSPVLQWVVSPNSKKLKYAWLFEDFEAACDKLEDLKFQETGKHKKADKAA